MLEFLIHLINVSIGAEKVGAFIDGLYISLYSSMLFGELLFIELLLVIGFEYSLSSDFLICQF